MTGSGAIVVVTSFFAVGICTLFQDNKKGKEEGEHLTKSAHCHFHHSTSLPDRKKSNRK